MTGIFLEDIASALFLVPFGLALIAILVGVSRWGKTRRARWLQGLCLFGIGSIIVLIIVSSEMANTELWTGFMNRMESSVLVFQSGRRSVTVTERGQIEMFFSLLRESRKVSAHHSYPLTEIQLTVGDKGYRYSIGPDSDHENEFWIDDWSCESCDGARTIAQVKSRSLVEYLCRLQVFEPLPES